MLEAGIEPARPFNRTPGFSYHYSFRYPKGLWSGLYLHPDPLDSPYGLFLKNLGAWVSSLYGAHQIQNESNVPTVLPVERIHRYPHVHSLSFLSEAHFLSPVRLPISPLEQYFSQNLGSTITEGPTSDKAEESGLQIIQRATSKKDQELLLTEFDSSNENDSMVFLKQYFGTLRRIGIILWVLVQIFNSLDYYLTQQIEEALVASSGMSTALWIYGVFSLGLGIFFPVLSTMITLFGLSYSEGTQRSLGDFLRRNINLMAIETLRSWGKALMGGLFFLIPGVYRLLMYSLVPFVVTFSKSYSLGLQDALEYSSHLVKRFWFRILMTILALQVLPPILLSPLTDEYKVLWETPVATLGISLLDSMIWVLAIQILYRLASQGLKEVSDEFAF